MARSDPQLHADADGRSGGVVSEARTAARDDIIAEVEAARSDGLALNPVKQELCCARADLVARHPHSGECWRDLACQVDIVKAGNTDILRDTDAAAVGFEYAACRKDIVGEEHGVRVGPAINETCEGLGAVFQREGSLTDEARIVSQLEGFDSLALAA